MLSVKVTGLRSYSIEKGCTEEINSLISRNNSFTQNLKDTKALGRRYPRCPAALSTVRTAQEKEFPLHPPCFPVCNPGAWTSRLCTASKSVAHKQATAEHGIKNPPQNPKKRKKILKDRVASQMQSFSSSLEWFSFLYHISDISNVCCTNSLSSSTSGIRIVSRFVI